jgi:hypothetical protein
MFGFYLPIDESVHPIDALRVPLDSSNSRFFFAAESSNREHEL